MTPMTAPAISRSTSSFFTFGPPLSTFQNICGHDDCRDPSCTGRFLRGAPLSSRLRGRDPSRRAAAAPRAAAFDHRLAACIANGGVFDFMGGKLPPGMTGEQMREYIRSDPDGMDKGMATMMESSTEMRWAVQNGMFTFKATSPADWFLKSLDYTLEGVADKVECPTLVIDTESEQFFPGAAKQLFDALTCPKTFMLFTAEEGAEDHCQVGTPMLAGQKIFDWLEETLAAIG